MKNETAIVRLGDGIGTSMFVEGSEWQTFEGDIFDGHNKEGETVDGLACLRHAELPDRELCFSTLFRELEVLKEVKPDGTKVYAKNLRKGFVAKFYNAINSDRKNRTCKKFQEIFWKMLCEEFNLTLPAGKFNLLLYLTTTKPMCKRKFDGCYIDQISICTTIDGAKIEPIEPAADTTPT